MYFKLHSLKSKCHLGYHLELILCVKIGLILDQSLVSTQHWSKHSLTISPNVLFIKGFTMGPSGGHHGLGSQRDNQVKQTTFLNR
jgi:hypothetical protein